MRPLHRHWLAFVALYVLGSFKRTAGFIVCVIPDAAWTQCVLGSTDPADFTGFEVDLFRYVSSAAGWQENSTATHSSIDSGTWAFRCSSIYWDAVEDVLGNGNVTLTTDPSLGQCAAALGSFIPTSMRFAQGVQFSVPHFQTGLAVMIATPSHTGFSQWAFLKPFDWSMWLGLGLTLLFMPAVVWFVERLNVHGFIPLSWSSVYECKDATYKTLLACFNIDVLSVTTLPAQLVVVVYLFLILITVSTYTANLASVFTAASSGASVLSSWRDLRGSAVGTVEIYGPWLQSRFGILHIAPSPFNDTVQQLAGGRAALLSGDLDAFVGEAEVVRQFVGTRSFNSDNKIRIVEFASSDSTANNALTFSYSIAFHASFPSAVIMRDVNAAVSKAAESGVLAMLRRKYWAYDVPDSALSHSVRFIELSGLWIVLAVVLGGAVLWSAWTIVSLARRHMRDIHHMHTLSGRPDLNSSTGSHSCPTSAGGPKSLRRSMLMGEAMARVFVPPSVVRAATEAVECAARGVRLGDPTAAAMQFIDADGAAMRARELAAAVEHQLRKASSGMWDSSNMARRPSTDLGPRHGAESPSVTALLRASSSIRMLEKTSGRRPTLSSPRLSRCPSNACLLFGSGGSESTHAAGGGVSGGNGGGSTGGSGGIALGVANSPIGGSVDGPSFHRRSSAAGAAPAPFPSLLTSALASAYGSLSYKHSHHRSTGSLSPLERDPVSAIGSGVHLPFIPDNNSGGGGCSGSGGEQRSPSYSAAAPHLQLRRNVTTTDFSTYRSAGAFTERPVENVVGRAAQGLQRHAGMDGGGNIPRGLAAIRIDAIGGVEVDHHRLAFSLESPSSRLPTPTHAGSLPHVFMSRLEEACGMARPGEVGVLMEPHSSPADICVGGGAGAVGVARVSGSMEEAAHLVRELEVELVTSASCPYQADM